MGRPTSSSTPRFTVPHHASSTVRDLRGGLRLALDGMRSAIGRMERLHARVAEVSPPVQGLPTGRPTQGVAAVVYRGLRGTTDLLGGAADLALASLQAGLQHPEHEHAPAQPLPARESLVAALNALAGDHLHRTDNPLATGLHLRQGGITLPRVLVLVHDLGLADLQWSRAGHDHGQALATDLPCTPLYVGYNSGRHVWASGRELAAELEQRLARWPVPLQGLALLGHGLGGLVLRSALHHAVRSGRAWPAHLRQLVFLGTPLAGAPLGGTVNLFARRGFGAHAALAPLARLARPSDGLADFLDGRFLEQDLPDASGATLTSLPPGAQAYAIAGCIGQGLGDGLVPEASALGLQGDTLGLGLDEAHRWRADGVDHLGLLASEAVSHKLRQWLAP